MTRILLILALAAAGAYAHQRDRLVDILPHMGADMLITGATDTIGRAGLTVPAGGKVADGPYTDSALFNDSTTNLLRAKLADGAFAGKTKFTFGWWAKYTSSRASGTRGIWSIQNGGNSMTDLTMALNQSAVFEFYVNTGKVTVAIGDSINKWIFFVVAVDLGAAGDNDDKARIYINGNIVDTAAVGVGGSFPATTDADLSDDSLNIGCARGTSSTVYRNRIYIDEFFYDSDSQYTQYGVARLWLAAKQSKNFIGVGQSLGLLSTNATDSVYGFYKVSTTPDIGVPTYIGQGSISIAPTVASILRRQYADTPIVFVDGAVGGTGLIPRNYLGEKDFWGYRNADSIGDTASLYGNTMRAAYFLGADVDAEFNPNDPNAVPFVGVFHQQGQQDAAVFSGNLKADYKRYCDTLYKWIRQDVGQPLLPVFYSMLGRGVGEAAADSSNPAIDSVRAAQFELQCSTNVLAASDMTELKPDGAHPTPSGMRKRAMQFVFALQRFLGFRSATGSGHPWFTQATHDKLKVNYAASGDSLVGVNKNQFTTLVGSSWVTPDSVKMQTKDTVQVYKDGKSSAYNTVRYLWGRQPVDSVLHYDTVVCTKVSKYVFELSTGTFDDSARFAEVLFINDNVAVGGWKYIWSVSGAQATLTSISRPNDSVPATFDSAIIWYRWPDLAQATSGDSINSPVWPFIPYYDGAAPSITSTIKPLGRTGDSAITLGSGFGSGTATLRGSAVTITRQVSDSVYWTVPDVLPGHVRWIYCNGELCDTTYFEKIRSTPVELFRRMGMWFRR